MIYCHRFWVLSSFLISSECGVPQFFHFSNCWRLVPRHATRHCHSGYKWGIVDKNHFTKLCVPQLFRQNCPEMLQLSSLFSIQSSSLVLLSAFRLTVLCMHVPCDHTTASLTRCLTPRQSRWWRQSEVQLNQIRNKSLLSYSWHTSPLCAGREEWVKWSQGAHLTAERKQMSASRLTYGEPHLVHGVRHVPTAWSLAMGYRERAT